MIELPGNLKDILVCEDVSLSFKDNRNGAGGRIRYC